MRTLTMADTHPRILRFLGARHPLFSLPASLVLTGIFFAGGDNSSSWWKQAGFGLAGMAYWTFLEYAIHRWIYHRRFTGRAAWFFETFHLHHHRDPGDDRVLNAGPLLVFPLAAIVLSPVFLLSGFSAEITSEVGMGTLAAYSFYEWVHYLIHRGAPAEKGYIAWMRRYHFHHHDHSWAANFGNTSPIWDLLFRTYRPTGDER